MTPTPIFDEQFMRKLEQLSLVARRVRAGHFKGDRRSTRRGQSIEFADYRNYVRGDDLRALDWNIYARLERPFIKLFEEEVDQNVYLVLDASASMDWPRQGEADLHKWNYARKLAAALGYIALVNSDRLRLNCLSGQENAAWGPERRRQSVHTLLGFLNQQMAQAGLSLTRSLTRYAQQAKRPGLVFILSDFLSDEDYQPAFRALQAKGHELTLLHLLAPDEIDPSLSGDFQLRDVETGQAQDITINATMRRLYQQKFEQWQGDLENYCRRRGLHYALIPTNTPFDSLVLQYFRRRGFVK